MQKIILFLSVFFNLALMAPAQEASGSQAILEGQIVCCPECFAEADRTKVEYGTAEDLLRAKSCVEGGDPTLIAVRANNKFELYQLEPGEFKLPDKNWLEFVGKKVAVTGTIRKVKKTNIIKVDALEILASSLAEQEAANVVGKEIPLKLKDLFGGEQTLSQFKGRIVILNFWATYCIPCRTEMPDLAAIQNEYAALGVQVIGASADGAAERTKVLQFIKETKINFPVWTGANAADMTRFGLGSALPGTVIIGRDGKIIRVISGIVNQAELKKQIDALLAAAESAVPPAETIAQKRKPSKASKQEDSQASSVPS